MSLMTLFYALVFNPKFHLCDVCSDVESLKDKSHILNVILVLRRCGRSLLGFLVMAMVISLISTLLGGVFILLSFCDFEYWQGKVTKYTSNHLGV